ncbi:hypothetical protein G6F56_003053 [Rhizopus delemar]|nr:hypothetical protein G6F56_003053 [Rhizopus delemar]
MPDETTLLLQRTESSKGHYDPTLKFRPLYKRTGPYDEDEQGLVQENTGIGFMIELKKGSSDGAQAWILVGMIGTTVAMIAWCIDVVQEWMSDIKQGYCTTGWQKNQKFCCTDTQDVCDAWKTWSSLLTQHETMYYTSMAIYTAFGLFFSLIAASMVKYTRERVRVRKGTQTVFSKSSSMASLLHVVDSVQTPEYETKTVYYSAGSGIPEVKVILSGFVIKGFLGIKTLIVKSIGMIFSTSAGLNVGKEGPFVHLACSAGNIACKRREILSASAAAGVAVAFGAPIGGVLFSLEEVSYYFPMKTMIRSYCCAMVAAVVLKIMDPFGTQKIVLFQVSYDKDYHLFELIPFIVCAVFSEKYRAITSVCYRGAVGALLLKDLRDHADPNIIIMLVGNKGDLNHRRAVPTEDAKQFACIIERDKLIVQHSAENGLSFIETSALNSSNVDLSLQQIVTDIHRIVSNKALESSSNTIKPTGGQVILVSQTPDKKAKQGGRCC